MSKPRILLLDLETLPIVQNHIDSLGEYNSDRYGLTLKAENNAVICFGFKFLGDKKARCVSNWDLKGTKNIQDDKTLLKYILEVVREADALVTHNGNNFDIKVLRTRLMLNGLPPMPDLPSIDTCALAKTKFYFIKNRLDYLADKLGTERKMKTGGWAMWKRLALSAYSEGPGVPTASEIKADKVAMSKYCAQDVEALESLYMTMRSHAKNIPNFQWFTEDRVCPACGSTKVHRHSRKVTRAGGYDRYQCQECATLSVMDKKGKLQR
jgi:predicted RNA-binding Zn-ribbon protein involved in translation (DUF1610 family)